MAETVVFTRSLYLPEAVEAAAEAYADYAAIALTSTGEAVTAVVSTEADEDLTHILHGFCNHALFETISRLRQPASTEAE